jgi:hypothetical protein
MASQPHHFWKPTPRLFCSSPFRTAHWNEDVLTSQKNFRGLNETKRESIPCGVFPVAQDYLEDPWGFVEYTRSRHLCAQAAEILTNKQTNEQTNNYKHLRENCSQTHMHPWNKFLRLSVSKAKLIPGLPNQIWQKNCSPPSIF